MADQKHNELLAKMVAIEAAIDKQQLLLVPGFETAEKKMRS